MRGVHTVLRVGAGVAAIGALAGVPVAVVRAGAPIPSLEEWRSVWTTHQVDSRFVIHVGLAVVGVLWLWFAVTACAEVVRFLAAPRLEEAPFAPQLVDEGIGGPTAWVRRWIRFIALSSAAVTGSVIVIASGVAQRPDTTRSVAAEVSIPTAVGSASTPSAVTPLAGLAGVSMLATGIVLAVQRRRHRRLRTATRGSQVAPPSLELVRAECSLRALASVERIARLDHATRGASAALAGSPVRVVAARIAQDGTVRVYLSGEQQPSDARWLVDGSASEWMLPASAQLAPAVQPVAEQQCPHPLLVAVGVDTAGWDCFVDLAAAGTLVVTSSMSSAILRSLAASLAWSPFMDHGSVLTVGVEHIASVDRVIERFDSTDAAAQRARELIDEPVALVVDTRAGTDGSGSFTADATERPSPTGLVIDEGHSLHRLVEHDGQHVLEPWGWSIVPPMASPELLGAASDLAEQADLPLERIASVLPIESPFGTVQFEEPEWQFLVRLLGQVEVVSVDGVAVPFERSKALELVVWLAVHRERPTRSKARAALWDAAVTAATFSNVVSDARRSMARVSAPPTESEWVARTLTDEMSLHPLVLTDADLLALRVEAARRMPSYEAIEVLRPGLELVTGLPFESSSYMWPDAEGHTSALVLLATDAATELAAHYLTLGDIDGVFWATGQGLKVLSGHEELIAMRMRAHAARGDRSGVRHEWESYERALAADPWSAADPSPKLVALRAELLTSDVWPTSARAASA